MKEFISWCIHNFDRYVLHFDDRLSEIAWVCGAWTYLLLFVVIFCETGLVVTPFLPGDSLLFVTGYLAADPEYHLNATGLFILLSLAAIAGDTANYWIGAYIGPRAFSGNVRFLKKEYLDRTHRFYERYGGKTIVLARFIPIIRTFAPFVAGIGAMNYGRFIVYNVVGGIAWVAIFLGGGYWLGSNLWVQAHRRPIFFAIIIISVMPMVVELLRARLAARRK